MKKQACIPYLSVEELSLEDLQRLLEQKGCRIFINTLNWTKDYPYQPVVVADVAYNEQGLFIHYFVHGEDIRTTSEGDGHYVHEDSCVEFFMQKEEGPSYINFEFNAAGVCYAAHHASPSESIKFVSEEFNRIERIATFKGQRLEQTEGLYDWHVTVRIPWTVMGYDEGTIPQSMRTNFYKCGDKTAHPHFLSWSPIDEPAPAFHRPQFFGELIFEKR